MYVLLFLFVVCLTLCGFKQERERKAYKEEALNDLSWEDEKGPSSIRPTLELFQLLQNLEYNFIF